VLPLRHLFGTEKEEYLRLLHLGLGFQLAPERIDRIQWFDIPTDRYTTPSW
jgi:hypothetical protein